jgi:small subunit ribosomal protein S6
MVVIISPEVGDDMINDSLERLQQNIAGRGGEVVDVNQWGRRRLAYPIRSHLEGNYVVSQIKLDPGQVPALESSLRISEEIVRHLIVKSGE